MKTKKILIGFDQYRADQIQRQSVTVQKAFIAYKAALGEQGLEFYTDIEKSLQEASKAVQINSQREVRQEAILSLIGILPQRPREAWNVAHRAITEMGIKWEDIDSDGRVSSEVMESLKEACNIYAEGAKATALANALFKVQEASEEFYALMQKQSNNRPNMGAIGSAFLGLLSSKGEAHLQINPHQFKMYSKD